MKKKIIAALLCVALTLSLAGCGEEKENSTPNNSTAQQSTDKPTSVPAESSSDQQGSDSAPESDQSDAIRLPEKITTAEPYAVNNIDYSFWTFVGGLSEEGTDYTDEQVAAILDGFGGHYNIFFNGGGKADVIVSEEGTPMTYELVNGNTMVTLKNENDYMAGMFTVADGVVVMMLVNQAAPASAYYFIQMDEH